MQWVCVFALQVALCLVPVASEGCVEYLLISEPEYISIVTLSQSFESGDFMRSGEGAIMTSSFTTM